MGLPSASSTACDVKFSEGMRLIKCFCRFFSCLRAAWLAPVLAPNHRSFSAPRNTTPSAGVLQTCILYNLVHGRIGLLQVRGQQLRIGGLISAGGLMGRDRSWFFLAHFLLALEAQRGHASRRRGGQRDEASSPAPRPCGDGSQDAGRASEQRRGRHGSWGLCSGLLLFHLTSLQDGARPSVSWGVCSRLVATGVAGKGRRLTSTLQDHGGRGRRRKGSAGRRNYILIGQGGRAENVRGAGVGGGQSA